MTTSSSLSSLFYSSRNHRSAGSVVRLALVILVLVIVIISITTTANSGVAVHSTLLKPTADGRGSHTERRPKRQLENGEALFGVEDVDYSRKPSASSTTLAASESPSPSRSSSSSVSPVPQRMQLEDIVRAVLASLNNTRAAVVATIWPAATPIPATNSPPSSKRKLKPEFRVGRRGGGLLRRNSVEDAGDSEDSEGEAANEDDDGSNPSAVLKVASEYRGLSRRQRAVDSLMWEEEVAEQEERQRERIRAQWAHMDTIYKRRAAVWAKERRRLGREAEEDEVVEGAAVEGTTNQKIARKEKQCNGMDLINLEHYALWWKKGTSGQHEYAYVTFVSSPDFVMGAAVLMYSIARTQSQYARAVCVTSNISPRDRSRLAAFAQVIEIEKINAPRRVSNPRYVDTFTKLRVWQLVMFKKVVYIDTDVLVVRNMDDLFDLEELSLPMDAEMDRYSTGMMVLQPSLTTFHDMMTHLNVTQVSMELPDLNFLKEFFEKKDEKATRSPPKRMPWSIGGNTMHHYLNIIPRWYQIYQEEFGSRYASYMTLRKQKLTIHDPRIHGIHYPGENKPWLHFDERTEKFFSKLCGWERRDELLYEPIFLWFRMYHLMKREVKASDVLDTLFDAENTVVVRLADTVTAAEKEEADRLRREEYYRSWYNTKRDDDASSWWQNRNNNNNNYPSRNNGGNDFKSYNNWTPMAAPRRVPAVDTSCALPSHGIDFSRVLPFAALLPQKWVGHDMQDPTEKSELYTWVVSWCRKMHLPPAGHMQCLHEAHAAQYSTSGYCATEFSSNFTMEPIVVTKHHRHHHHRHHNGKNPDYFQNISRTNSSLLHNHSEFNVTNHNASDSTANTTVRTPLSGVNGTNFFSNISNSSGRGSMNATANFSVETVPNITTSRAIPSAAPAVEDHDDDEVLGVVFTSTWYTYYRQKRMYVVVRCDWSLQSEVDVFLEEEVNPTTAGNSTLNATEAPANIVPYVRLEDDPDEDSTDRHYFLRLRSRCACRGGCTGAQIDSRNKNNSNTNATSNVTLDNNITKNNSTVAATNISSAAPHHDDNDAGAIPYFSNMKLSDSRFEGADFDDPPHVWARRAAGMVRRAATVAPTPPPPPLPTTSNNKNNNKTVSSFIPCAARANAMCSTIDNWCEVSPENRCIDVMAPWVQVHSQSDGLSSDCEWLGGFASDGSSVALCRLSAPANTNLILFHTGEGTTQNRCQWRRCDPKPRTPGTPDVDLKVVPAKGTVLGFAWDMFVSSA
eukprot:PhM_4_TR15955/c0_g1_i3/m.102836